MSYTDEEMYDNVMAYKKELENIHIKLEEAANKFISDNTTSLVFLGKERFQDILIKETNNVSAKEDIWL